MELAFFVTEFHFTKADYESLTPAEVAFVMKAWEDKTVRDTTYNRDAVLNAVTNALRKKSQRFRKLWKKAGTMTEDKQLDMKQKIRTIEAIEKKSGKGWLDVILKNAGIRRKGGKGHDS